MLTILLLIINYITCSHFEEKMVRGRYKRQTRQVKISSWHLKCEGTGIWANDVNTHKQTSPGYEP